MLSMSKLSYHISLPKQQHNSLWSNSPCTLSYARQLPPIDRAQRFQYNSIYYKDDPFKPARKVDAFQKPDLLLIQFRKSIREAEQISKSKLKSNNSSIKNKLKQRQNTYGFSSLKQKEIIERLCPQKPRMLKLQYDLYGNRSSFYEQKQNINLKKLKKNPQINKKIDMFTDSERIDMSKPENFNPGPGYYFNSHSKKKIQLKKISKQQKQNIIDLNIKDHDRKRSQLLDYRLSSIQRNKTKNKSQQISIQSDENEDDDEQAENQQNFEQQQKQK